MQTLWQDIRYALRTLFKNPGFTATAVLTLALGIGANSAIFSVVNSILLRRLPYPDAGRLVTVYGRYESTGPANASLPDFRDWRARSRSFSDLAARHGAVFNLSGAGQAEQLTADRVTANFFRTLGVRPALGRDFRLEEEQMGGDDDVVILSDGLWRRHFGADPAVIGRTIRLSERSFTVIGVAPAGFHFWRTVDLWAPARVDTTANRRAEYLAVFGRLKPGVSAAAAQREVSGVARQLAAEYPATNDSWTSLELTPLKDYLVGGLRKALLVFMAAVGLVLLIACANVANLLLARASVREREMAIRTALGAARGRLVRQLLTESVLLAALGGIAGLALAAWSLDGLRSIGGSLLPRFDEVRMDGAALAFSLGLALLTGLVFGLVPALRLATASTSAQLREGTRGSAGGAVTRLRNALVLGEIAVALVLLVGAGLLLRSFARLNDVDPGFRPDGVLTYSLLLPGAKYGEPGQQAAFYDQLLDRTRDMGGVSSVAVSGSLPMAPSSYVTFSIEGRTPPPDAAEDVQPFAVSPDYFRTLGIGLRRGRGIEPRDAADAPRVAVINEEMARRFFGGRDPLGHRLTFGDPADPATTWRTIVGVVGNVAQEGVTAAAYPQVYLAIAQAPQRLLNVAIRTSGDPLALAPAARAALASVDPDLPIKDMQPMRERISADLAQPRVSVAVLGVFAALALALAAIGIYGVMSYVVAQRSREIGIRLALGARAEDVRMLVVRQGMRPAVMGIALGLAGALALTRVMKSLLYGVTATDPLTFIGVAGFLGIVAFGATYLPARRATRVDPMNALRSE